MSDEFTDARTITGVTLNGGSSVTVVPNGTITVVVNVTTTSAGSPNWRSTCWQIGTATGYFNNNNHTTAGNYTETFTIQWSELPGPGTYDLIVGVYQNELCSQGESLITIPNAVTIASANFTPPVITKTVAGTTGNNGWYTSDVSVDWTVTDPDSAVTLTGCTDLTINSDTSNASSSCSATSAGGTSSDSVTVKRDTSAPNSVTGAPNRAPDQGSWYNHAVDVIFTGSDGTSGIASCSTATYSGPDASGVTVSGSCTDNAGHVGTGASSAFNYDGSAPVLSLPANITTQATGPSGAIVSYVAGVTDHLDGSVTVNCSPASGSTFSMGTTVVSCSSTDAAGNTALGGFQVTVGSTPNTPPPAVIVTTPVPGSIPVSSSTSTASTSSSRSPSTLLPFVIPLTGGELINLDCNTVFWAFGIKLSYFELCDQQTTVHKIDTSDLPAKLPAGFSFVMGLNIDVLSDGQIIEELPAESGIEMDFPLYNQSQDKFAVLYWSAEDGDGKGEWIEVSKQIGMDKISQAVSTGDDLYQLVNKSSSQGFTNLFYQTLTTNKTGVFVLVKK